MKVVEIKPQALETMLMNFAGEQRRLHGSRLKYSLWKSLKDMILDNQPISFINKEYKSTILFQSSRRTVEIDSKEDSFFCEFCINYFGEETEEGVYIIPTCNKPVKIVLEKGINEEKKQLNKQPVEESKNMMNIKGFEFGVVNSPLVRLSHLGVAVRNKMGVFVSFDAKKNQLIDVDLFDFDMEGMIYKMPVAIKDVKPGDVIYHNQVPMIVTKLDIIGTVVDTENKTASFNNLTVVDPVAGESKTIMPTRNMFGFDFVTKIVSLIDMNTLGASEDSPFGNMLPLMMMSGMKSGNGNKMESMLPMLMMSQMSGGKNDMFSNPMMMMALMGGEDNDSMLPMLMMSGMFNK